MNSTRGSVVSTYVFALVLVSLVAVLAHAGCTERSAAENAARGGASPAPVGAAKTMSVPETKSAEPRASDEGTAGLAEAPAKAVVVPAAGTGSNASPGTGCGPIEELGQMDNRTPVPLQPMMAWHQKQNMNEHLVAVYKITDALAREDWDGISEASKLIESSPQMAQMCRHMGAGAEGFTDLALEFHRRADAIGTAADSKDATAVLKATAHTLQACTSCHATYRQDIVDAETWQARTGTAHDPSQMMHHGVASPMGGHHP